MHEFFNPASIVIFGVSDDPKNMGKQIVENLDNFGFKNPVYLIGKNEGVYGERKIYKCVEDIEEIPGLAVFLIPARYIPDALDECGKKGIRYAVIESGGFAEAGEEGNRQTIQLLKIAKKWDIRFVGPNCLSIVNIENGLVLPFHPLYPNMTKKGNISLIAQSGGIVVDTILYLAFENIGFSKMISIGNKLNISENDCIEYMISDPETKIIGLYLEGIDDGRKLINLAKKTDKPIIVLKANTNSSSNKIANFHTASLAADDQVVEAAFEQAGLIRVKSFQEMIDCYKIFSLPPIKGNKLGIICRSGGQAVMTSDFADRYGFKLAEFSKEFYEFTQERTRAGVIQMTNPIDLGDVFDINAYVDIVDKAVQEDAINGLVIHHNYRDATEPTRNFIKAVSEISIKYKKPIIFSMLPDKMEWFSIKEETNYPLFTGTEQALRCLQLAYKFYQREKHPEVPLEIQKPVPNEAAKVKLKFLKADEASKLLKSYNLSVPDYKIVDSVISGKKAAQKIGYPVALKLADPYILHKTEEKGVKLNIKDEKELQLAFQEMTGDTFLIQKMLLPGQEVIIGGKRDATFGPVILFGLGGIFVEVLQDVSLRVAPVNYEEAKSMIEKIKGVRLLNGFRGKKGVDKESLIKALVNVSNLLTEHPEIKNLDINPLFVWEKGRGCSAVDVKIEITT